MYSYRYKICVGIEFLVNQATMIIILIMKHINTLNPTNDLYLLLYTMAMAMTITMTCIRMRLTKQLQSH